MTQIGELWAGRTYGTNIANIFVELTETDPANIVGKLRILDNTYGVSVYSLHGTFADILHLNGSPEPPIAEDAVLGELTIEGRLTPEGNIRGTWKTTIGTGGTFELYPHDVNSARSDTNSPESDIPEQIYARNVTLGAIKLYRDEISKLIKYITEDFTSGRVVATYNLRGSQVTKYAEDFLADPNIKESALNYLKLQTQEPEAHGINKLVIVEFNADGTNEVRVQGIRESWVIGKSEAIVGYLRKYEQILITTYKRFGLNLNIVIFLAIIVLIPEIESLFDRTLFVGGVFIILQALISIHQRVIPNASLQVGEGKPSFIQSIWPTVLSWIIGASSSLAAALLFYWLTTN